MTTICLQAHIFLLARINRDCFVVLGVPAFRAALISQPLESRTFGEVSLVTTRRDMPTTDRFAPSGKRWWRKGWAGYGLFQSRWRWTRKPHQRLHAISSARGVVVLKLRKGRPLQTLERVGRSGRIRLLECRSALLNVSRPLPHRDCRAILGYSRKGRLYAGCRQIGARLEGRVAAAFAMDAFRPRGRSAAAKN